jgi:hypothetical protein
VKTHIEHPLNMPEYTIADARTIQKFTASGSSPKASFANGRLSAASWCSTANSVEKDEF